MTYNAAVQLSELNEAGQQDILATFGLICPTEKKNLLTRMSN